ERFFLSGRVLVVGGKGINAQRESRVADLHPDAIVAAETTQRKSSLRVGLYRSGPGPQIAWRIPVLDAHDLAHIVLRQADPLDMHGDVGGRLTLQVDQSPTEDSLRGELDFCLRTLGVAG